MQVNRLWRGLAVAAAAGTAIASAAIPAQAAGPATYSVTISAKAALPNITGYTVVFYKSGKYSNATIHGSVTGAVAGDVARLYAQPFPYKTPPVRVSAATLKPTGTTPAPYSFQVRPALATRYRVAIMTGSQTDVTSAQQIVYVGTGGKWLKYNQCRTRPTCHMTLRLDVWMPRSAYKVEAAKHQYFYLSVKRTAHREPGLPKYLYLDKKVSTSVKKINSGEFEVTYKFAMDIGTGGYRWLSSACQQDDVARDGIGLPGHHGCGDKRMRANALYLG